MAAKLATVRQQTDSAVGRTFIGRTEIRPTADRRMDAAFDGMSVCEAVAVRLTSEVRWRKMPPKRIASWSA
jgi:hypothetical protein